MRPSTRATDRLFHVSLVLPVRLELEGVPFVPQTAYQCGPASLAMVLAWVGHPVRPDELGRSIRARGKAAFPRT